MIYAGIVGAGTNHARLAGLLRQLSAYYYKVQPREAMVAAAVGTACISRHVAEWPEFTGVLTAVTLSTPNE